MLKEIGMFGFVAMLVFLAILVVGFIYEWKKERWNGVEGILEKALSPPRLTRSSTGPAPARCGR